MRNGLRGRAIGALCLMVTLPVLAGAREVPDYVEQGPASWYGPGFHGKPTASGERFDQHALTAAHPDLPLGTVASVTNLENGKTVEVQINDRGPYVSGRIIDLSRAAAREIDMIEAGVAPVRVEVGRVQVAQASPRD